MFFIVISQNFFLHLTFTNISRWNIYIHFCLFHHSSTNQFILALDSHAHYFFCLFISICFEFNSDRWWWWWRKPGNCHTNIHAQWWIFELFVFFFTIDFLALNSLIIINIYSNIVFQNVCANPKCRKKQKNKMKKWINELFHMAHFAFEPSSSW